jgi:hypothetical protein
MRGNRLFPLIGAVLGVSLSGCSEATGPDASRTAFLQTGNGAPNGAHYNLNIIGTSVKNGDLSGNGNVIFVLLNGRTNILLCESGVGTACANVSGFQVLDKDGTDGEASFALPNPDPTNSGTTRYSVFARALGKPGGGADVRTCATEPISGDFICSLAVLELDRGHGKQSFENVSKELLYIYFDIDGDGTVDRVPLFDDSLQNFLWEWSNTGLRLAQLRFYPCPTTVPDGPDFEDPVISACFD